MTGLVWWSCCQLRACCYSSRVRDPVEQQRLFWRVLMMFYSKVRQCKTRSNEGKTQGCAEELNWFSVTPEDSLQRAGWTEVANHTIDKTKPCFSKLTVSPKMESWCIRHISLLTRHDCSMKRRFSLPLIVQPHSQMKELKMLPHEDWRDLLKPGTDLTLSASGRVGQAAEEVTKTLRHLQQEQRR